MTAYVPQPGTIPARAVDYLRTLAAGIEVPTAVLGEALDQPSSTISVCLEAAVNSGLVRKRRKDGERFMIWSIGDGVPISRATLTEPDEYPIEQRIVPAAASPGVSIDAVHAKAAARKKPGPKPSNAKAKPEGASVQRDVVQYIRAIERSVPPDPTPAAAPGQMPRVRAGTTPYRFGLFNDGEFVQEKGGQTIVLQRVEFESLVNFLERMAVAS